MEVSKENYIKKNYQNYEIQFLFTEFTNNIYPICNFKSDKL